MDQSPDLEAVRRAAIVRRDYVIWLAQSLENRARIAPGQRYGEMDAEIDRTAAAELRSLVSHD
jgi:hypothetical protein